MKEFKGKFCLSIIEKEGHRALIESFGAGIINEDFEAAPVCKVSELTEEQAASVVDCQYIQGVGVRYKEYLSNPEDRASVLFYARESFSFLLESLGIIETENLYLFKIIE